jgi:hypothetical protein
MYVVFGEIIAGLEKFTCCQPDELSPAKVALASSCPDVVHKFPTCVPVFVDAL